MAWKSYALGSGSIDHLARCAEIITEELGTCTYNSSSRKLSYTYDGVTYEVGCVAGDINHQILFLNDKTGEFILSYSGNNYLTSSTTINNVLICAILLVERADGTKVLAPMVSYADTKPSRYFSIPALDEGSNATTDIVLVPMVTNGKYNNLNYPYPDNFRPVINMFTGAIRGINVGTTIQVAGQNFLCVAPTMFEKL